MNSTGHAWSWQYHDQQGTDKILAWQGIEATQKLAESANAKVVVIGTGKEGPPLIFNATSSATPATVAKSNP